VIYHGLPATRVEKVDQRCLEFLIVRPNRTSTWPERDNEFYT